MNVQTLIAVTAVHFQLRNLFMKCSRAVETSRMCAKSFRNLVRLSLAQRHLFIDPGLLALLRQYSPREMRCGSACDLFRPVGKVAAGGQGAVWQDDLEGLQLTHRSDWIDGISRSRIFRPGSKNSKMK